MKNLGCSSTIDVVDLELILVQIHLNASDLSLKLHVSKLQKLSYTTTSLITLNLIPKVLFIQFWAFVVLGRYVGLQLFLEICETFYECAISLELCGKLIFIKCGLTV